MAVWDGHMHIDLEPPYLIVKPGLSEDDFYRLADEDSDWEYLDGRIVMHSPASNRHEDLFSFLMTLLRAFLGEKGGAVVRGSRYPMRLDVNWSPEPDLMVVLERRRHLMTSQRLEGPADMVIELASASDPRLDRREKLPRYRDAGIPEMWFIDPYDQIVRVERKTDEGYVTTTLSAGRLASAVVPGFWIEVAWLWQEELPAALRCLREMMA
jgi:Uma2 family endonuclease